MTSGQGSLFSFNGLTPRLDPASYVAPGARLIGEVRLGPWASVWFNAVLRGDLAGIEIGEGSNVQDLTTVHVEGAGERAPGSPALGVRIGRYTTVGHNCVIHSCEIGDDCLIGMNATLMNGVVIGHGSIVGAGALVLEDMVAPPFSLLTGAPARVRKTYAPSIVEEVIRRTAHSYIERVKAFREQLAPAG